MKMVIILLQHIAEMSTAAMLLSPFFIFYFIFIFDPQFAYSLCHFHLALVKNKGCSVLSLYH